MKIYGVNTSHDTALCVNDDGVIKDVFEEKALAKLVKSAKSPEEIRLHIYKHVIKQHIRR